MPRVSGGGLSMILVSPRTRRGMGPSALSSVVNFFSPGWSHGRVCVVPPSGNDFTLAKPPFLKLCWLTPRSEVRSPGDAGPLTGYIRHEIRLQVSNLHSTAATRDAEAPRKLKKPQNAATSCNPCCFMSEKLRLHLACARSKVSPPNVGFFSFSPERGVCSH